jgi:hypothetical protein
MVIKKAIGTIVCGVILGGNCMASGRDGDGPRKAAVDIPTAGEADVDSGQQMALKGKKLDQSSRRTQVTSQEEELATLRQQMDAILQGRKGEAGERRIIPFVSVKALRRYVKRIEDGETNEDDLSERIDSTVDYFLYKKGQEISGPVTIIGDWPRSKCIEILYIIKRRFPGAAAACQGGIRTVTEGDVIYYAQLLLMSQCATWNEGNNEYELDSCANESIVKAAIDILRSVVTLGAISFPEDVTERAKNFLNMIKGLNGFREYCYSISSD